MSCSNSSFKSVFFAGLGNQDTSDPNSKVFVDPAALSQISEVEYDYSDLYDYEEDELELDVEEGGKSRRETKEGEEMTTRMAEEKTSTEKPAARRKPLVLISKVVEKIVKKKKQTILKEEKASYLQSLNGVEESKVSESEKISMNVIRSAGEEEDISEDQPEEEEDINEDERDATSKENVVSTTARYDGERMVTTENMSDMPTTERSTPAAKSTSRAETVEPSETPLKLKENVTIRSEKRKNGTAVDLERKERIKRELAELEGLFEATMAALSREDISDSSLHRVAWRLRTKRADSEMESSTSRNNNNGSQPDKDACVVRNMTCVKFPSRKHCKGIALGR